MAFAPLPGAEPPSLYVGVSLDRAEIVAGARREFANNLAVLLLVGAIVAVVAWFGAQAVVVRRVEALVGATERLREGDLSARTGLPYGRGELSVLSRAFDVMAAALERGLEARERDEARLRASEAHKSAVLEAALDGLMVLDGDGVLLEWNPAARRLFGAREPGDSRPRAGHLLPGLELPGANEAGDGRRFETVGLRADGTEFPVEVGLTRIAGRAQFVATVRDLTERKRWERSVEALTFVDDLTGLFNRRGFSMFAAQQLRLAARSGQRVVIVSADVDGLKAINDTYGHAEGDRAIIEMAGPAAAQLPRDGRGRALRRRRVRGARDRNRVERRGLGAGAACEPARAAELGRRNELAAAGELRLDPHGLPVGAAARRADRTRRRAHVRASPGRPRRSSVSLGARPAW